MSDRSPRKQICCCHVKKATTAIAILVMIAAGCGMIASVVLGLNAGGFKGLLQVLLGLFICFANVIFAGLLLIGVKRHSAGFMIIYLVWQVLSLIGWLVLMTIVGVGLTAVAAMANQEKDAVNREHMRKEGVALVGYMAVCAVLLVSGLVFFVVILRCYQYMRDAPTDHSATSLSLIS